MNRQIVVSCDGVSGDYGTRSYEAWSNRADLLREYAERLGFSVYTEHSADTDDPITPVGRKLAVPRPPRPRRRRLPSGRGTRLPEPLDRLTPFPLLNGATR